MCSRMSDKTQPKSLARACLSCRARKTRCDTARPRCTTCITQAKECVYRQEAPQRRCVNHQDRISLTLWRVVADSVDDTDQRWRGFTSSRNRKLLETLSLPLSNPPLRRKEKDCWKQYRCVMGRLNYRARVTTSTIPSPKHLLNGDSSPQRQKWAENRGTGAAVVWVVSMIHRTKNSTLGPFFLWTKQESPAVLDLLPPCIITRETAAHRRNQLHLWREITSGIP